MFSKHIAPVLLVAFLSLGNLHQNLTVFTFGSLGQIAVDARLRLFIGEITPPPPDLRLTWLGDGLVPCRYMVKRSCACRRWGRG